MKPELTIVPERPAVELDPVRCFTERQKAVIFETTRGRCELCGAKIRGTWIAGHIIPHSLGGKTVISNGRVECMECAVHTHEADTSTAAKCKRLMGLTGQRARREKHGSKLKSRGFDKTLRKRMNGKTERRDER